MANELQLNRPGETGLTMYAIVFDETGQAWNGSAFATYTTTRGDFDIPMTEISGTGLYRASFPGTAGRRKWEYYQQAGGSPSHANDIMRQCGSGYWDGVMIGERVGSLADDSITPGSVSAGAVGKIWAYVLAGAYTVAQVLRGIASATAGKLSGAGTVTEVYRSIDDSKTAITATVTEDGNRTAITLDLDP